MPNSLTLLMVDDDVDDRYLFIEVVDEIDSKIVCKTANNGMEAMNFLNSSAKLPDLIFMDLNMPRMNGFACLEMIKKTAGLAHLPVIIYTTSRSPLDKATAKRLGAEYFVTKPDNMEELKKVLPGLLSGFRGSNSNASHDKGSLANKS